VDGMQHVGIASAASVTPPPELDLPKGDLTVRNYIQIVVANTLLQFFISFFISFLSLLRSLLFRNSSLFFAGGGGGGPFSRLLSRW
jgi:hypothetical protein